MCQFSCHHHLYKNLTHKPFSPSAVLCTIPFQIWTPCSARHMGKEHGTQVETGRSKVKGPCMNWYPSSGTSVSLKTQMPNSVLLRILATVTALSMAEHGWGGGVQTDKNMTFGCEGMLSGSSVVSWHHTFTGGFSSPCVFKVAGRLLLFYRALQPNSCQSGEDRGMKTVLEVIVQLLTSMYKWHENHTVHLWVWHGLHILN